MTILTVFSALFSVLIVIDSCLLLFVMMISYTWSESPVDWVVGLLTYLWLYGLVLRPFLNSLDISQLVLREVE